MKMTLSSMTIIAVAMVETASGASGPELNILHKEIGVDHVSFVGVPWQEYYLQYSTNLDTWKHSKVCKGTSNGVHMEIMSYGHGHMFYRLGEASTNDTIVMSMADAMMPWKYAAVISETQSTRSVPLGAFDIKLPMFMGTMRSLDVEIFATGNMPISELFEKVTLKIGSIEYAASSIVPLGEKTGGAIASFRNIDFPMAPDAWMTFGVFVDVPADSGRARNGVAVTTEFYARGSGGGRSNNPAVEDMHNEPLDVMESRISGSTVILTDL